MMVRWLALIYFLGLFLIPANGLAHESRPAYLEITETQSGQYDVLWKRPMRGDRVLGLHPQFPSHCRQITPAATYNSPGAKLERRSLDCGGSGLIGTTIRIDGLSTTLTDVLARVSFLDGSGKGTEDEGPALDRPAWAFSREHRTDLLASRLSLDKPDGIRGQGRWQE